MFRASINNSFLSDLLQIISKQPRTTGYWKKISKWKKECKTKEQTNKNNRGSVDFPEKNDVKNFKLLLIFFKETRESIEAMKGKGTLTRNWKTS